MTAESSRSSIIDLYPPIFQTKLVNMSDVGEYTIRLVMRQQLSSKCNEVLRSHVEKAKAGEGKMNMNRLARDIRSMKFVPPPPRRMLISSMKSDRLVISSPLVRWYLERGLDVQIMQFIEYRRMKCFALFVDKVSKARQSGNAVTALALKTVGNSAYGSLIVDRSRFTRTLFVRWEKEL